MLWFYRISIVIAALLHKAVAQFAYDSPQFDQLHEARIDALEFQVTNHPDVQHIFHPMKYTIPIDFYEYTKPVGYTMNVLFDPCRDQAVDCCNDTFGTPEFIQVDTDPKSRFFGDTFFFNDDGSRLAEEESRRPDREVYYKEECTGPYQPTVDCIANRMAEKTFQLLPKCWNHNDTIIGNTGCRHPKFGTPLPLCFELAFTQSALIIECGNKFKTDPHCGTFLEIHKPGNEEILSVTKLRGQFTSGYRTTVISTTYKGNFSRVLCGGGGGQYEVWWVQRTRYNWIVQRKIPFRIISPDCEYDFVNNRYFPFTSLEKIAALTGIDEFDASRFLFTSPAGLSEFTSSSMGAPGMGAANEPSAAPQAPRPKPIPKQLEPLPPGSWNWTSYNSDWNGPALPYYDYHVRDPRWGGGVVGNVTPPANPNLNF